MPKRSSVVRCALCDWSIQAWRTERDGKPRSGYTNLQQHMSLAHPKYLKAVNRMLYKLDSDRASLLRALSQ